MIPKTHCSLQRTASCLLALSIILLLLPAAASPAPASQVVSIQAISDPSVAAEVLRDPFSEITPEFVDVYHPNRELYNTLFQAVMEKEKKVNLSSFDLSLKEINGTASCLYSEAGYRFFYLYRYKLAKDCKSITFSYRKEIKDLPYTKETFNARLSHLLNNVAPADYDELQKFMAVYDYLTRTTGYASDMTDDNIGNPANLLLKGEGICGAYSNLTAYTLRHLGLEAHFVCNEPHSWNLVKLQGDWYQSDTTWGAGASPDAYNNLRTMLMDDETRLRTLQENGTSTEGIILGYQKENPPVPPACTATKLLAYTSIGDIFAFDFANSKIYFSSGSDIMRMNLDCTGLETLQKDAQSYRMAYFDGTLYYLSFSDSLVHRLAPGHAPETVEGTENTYHMVLRGTTLYCAADRTPQGAKTLPLLPLPEETKKAAAFPAAELPRGQTFRMEIAFSIPQNAAQNWNRLVYLADETGTTYPLHFSLSIDGKTLTVRSRDYLDGQSAFTLYVLSGSSENKESCQAMQLHLVSQAKGK